MYKLTFKTRALIDKQYLGELSASKIALTQKIHRSVVYQTHLQAYKKDGGDGLRP